MELQQGPTKALKALSFVLFSLLYAERRKMKNHITHSAFIQRIVLFKGHQCHTQSVRFEKIFSHIYNIWWKFYHTTWKKELLRLWLQSILFVNNNWIFVRRMCDKFISFLSILCFSLLPQHIRNKKHWLGANLWGWSHRKNQKKDPQNNNRNNNINDVRIGRTHIINC